MRMAQLSKKASSGVFEAESLSSFSNSSLVLWLCLMRATRARSISLSASECLRLLLLELLELLLRVVVLDAGVRGVGGLLLSVPEWHPTDERTFLQGKNILF